MTTTSIPKSGREGGVAQRSTPTRVLEGLTLARDFRNEFKRLEDGSYMVPSRSRKLRHNATADTCSCEDRLYGGYRCAHSVAVLALEVARSECRGRGHEQDLRVEAVLDLMVQVESPAPPRAGVRWIECAMEDIRWQSYGLVGVSERMRESIAGAALARRDLAFLEVRRG